MAGREANNMRIVERGLKILTEHKDRIIEAGMRDLMENAMLYAIGEHDNNHWFHKSTGDSYGWALIHNGSAVAHKVNEGVHGDGYAYEQLMEASREVPQTGWVGILLASFRAGNDRPTPRMFLFDVEYERVILNSTKIHIEDHFDEFFKPIR